MFDRVVNASAWLVVLFILSPLIIIIGGSFTETTYVAFPPQLDTQAQAARQPDIPLVSRLPIPHPLVPEFPCTKERLAGRDRAGSVEGAPARRTPSLTGGNS